MANAYFSNCVADTIGLTLNQSLSANLLERRPDHQGGDTNALPTIDFPIADGDITKSKMSLGLRNEIMVTFESLKPDSNTYFIEIDKSLSGQDLYFYVFGNTLVGTDTSGRAAGISIGVEATVKTTIQGNQPMQGLELLVPQIIPPEKSE